MITGHSPGLAIGLGYFSGALTVDVFAFFYVYRQGILEGRLDGAG